MLGKSGRSDQDFDDEIQSHIEIEADRLVEEGMDREQAVATARRALEDEAAYWHAVGGKYAFA